MNSFEMLTAPFLDSKLEIVLTLEAVLSAALLLFLEIPHLPTLRLPLLTPPVCILPLFNLAHLVLSSKEALPPYPCLQTSYPLFAHIAFLSRFSPRPHMFLAVFSMLFLYPLTRSGSFKRILEVSEPLALKYHILSCLILLTLFDPGIQP